MMPGINGFETLDRLKSLPETNHIPVIIVTSKSISEAEQQILNKETLAVISKGFTSREETIGKIRDAVERIVQQKLTGEGR